MRYRAWTAKDVEARVLEAAETELALPRPKGPKMFGSSMPEPVRDRREAYGYSQARFRRTPSPGAISRYEIVLGWLMILPVIDRATLWYWAIAKVSPRRSLRSFAEEHNINSRTLRRKITSICQTIANNLNRQFAVRLTIPVDHVSEDQADSASETLSSVTYASYWRAPDAKPRHLPERLEPIQRSPAKKREG